MYALEIDLQFLISLKSDVLTEIGRSALSQISQVSSENIAVSSKTDKLLKHFAHVLKSKQDRIKIAISA